MQVTWYLHQGRKGVTCSISDSLASTKNDHGICLFTFLTLILPTFWLPNGLLTTISRFKECSRFTRIMWLKLDKGQYLALLGTFFGSHDAGDSPNLGLLMAQPNRCIGSTSRKSPNTVCYVEETQLLRFVVANTQGESRTGLSKAIPNWSLVAGDRPIV